MPSSPPNEAPKINGAPTLDDILERNIQVLVTRRRSIGNSPGELIAARISALIGSFEFLAMHALVFGVWIAVNTIGVGSLPRFDPSLALLGAWTSVEAIFLSTFVLMTQNRNSAAADQRAELDLQINLLAEHELTRLIHLVSALAERLSVRTTVDEEIEELKQDVAVTAVLDKLENAGNGNITNTAQGTPEDEALPLVDLFPQA